MKIGIIQSRGIGDIVIALPIAQFYIDRGDEVYWPIDSRFLSHFHKSFPDINFIEIDVNVFKENSLEYFYGIPFEILKGIKCEEIFTLYSYLSDTQIQNVRLSESLTFDAYKYAISKVPFKEKWNLNPVRNQSREVEIYKKIDLDPSSEYIIIHNEGSNFKADFTPLIMNSNLKVVEIKPLTDCIFDWLSVIEGAKMGIFVDSVYANVIEQLKIDIPKILYLRSVTKFTPVFINNWIYK